MSITLQKVKASKKTHKLKSFFLRVGISQIELSRYLGIGYNSVNQYLNGYRAMPKVTEQQLKTLAENIQAELS